MALEETTNDALIEIQKSLLEITKPLVEIKVQTMVTPRGDTGLDRDTLDLAIDSIINLTRQVGKLSLTFARHISDNRTLDILDSEIDE
ncbi:hypothetical protein [Lysinibacter sp. HNR]|uniref:hypothetical protein n=1 Tax=Lysinibacter sp. HNR TaxID=3031408 RepID=UPI002435A301|nr:hypothetical protein [Lysinibacter sp. HNR]WGD38504.1 hypothetical protein FrondiHNR_06225 [Lysinibacter sp. HNR]